MQDLKYIVTGILIELLAIYTAVYTNMLSNNLKGQAFYDFEFKIRRQQAIIPARQQGMNDFKITIIQNY